MAIDFDAAAEYGLQRHRDILYIIDRARDRSISYSTSLLITLLQCILGSAHGMMREVTTRDRCRGLAAPAAARDVEIVG
jgi:hypothetical protein